VNEEERVEWVGGPLDGCVAHRRLMAPWWMGPNPADTDSLVWYRLERREEGPRYIYVPEGPPR
jgi:hypothetical protein